MQQFPAEASSADGLSPAGRQADARSESEGSLRGFRLVSLCTLASRVLGMIRDMAMAAAFGAGPVMDAFSLAFRIPNLARRLFGEGAQTSAFLPAFVRMQEHSGRPAAQDLAAGMFLALGGVLATLVLVAEAALTLTWLCVPLSPDGRLLVELLMWLTPYLIGICLAAQQSAVLHGLRQFLWPAVLPLVLNLIWLAALPAAFLLSRDEVARMKGLCGAILLAGGVQLAIPLVVLRRQGFPLWRPRAVASAPVWGVFRALGPVLLGVTITQINTVFDSVIAWGLSPGTDGQTWLGRWLPSLPNGTASALYFGQRMYQFPLGLIGVALGTVLFPQLARQAERGDVSQFNRDISQGLSLTLSIGVPAGWGLMLLALPITRLLFQHGAFSPEAGQLTAGMIVAYGPAVAAFIGLMVVQRGYYAVGDRVTPVRHGLAAMGMNLVLDVALLFPLGAVGLAWATSLAACVQLGLAVHGLPRYCGPLDWPRLRRTAAQTLAGCTTMTLVLLALPAATGEGLSRRAWDVALPLCLGVVTYLGTAWAVGLKDPWRLMRHGSL
jgi:putative peptidoglycan lipid II flippase